MQPKPPFTDVQTALEEIRAGRMIVIVDDEDRENEGDLMLRHAFEAWKCLRVELKTDALNERSRRAILRLGAKEEGTLRKHMVSWNGRQRDSVYFSILDSEWPQVKAGLESKLGASELQTSSPSS